MNNDEVLADLGIKREDLVAKTAVEVGNIFTLGTKYSDALELYYTDEKGAKQPVFMGSYGIGPSRVMGLIAEHFSDNKGLVWPVNVAPYHVYLVSIGNITEQTDDIYNNLLSAGIETLYDDRDERPGVKFADAELMGIPFRIVISERSLETASVELTDRASGETIMVPLDKITPELQEKCKR